MKYSEKLAIVKTIEKFMKKHDLNYDVNIYFSNKCWGYDSSGRKTISTDVKGSDYTNYANDETITMTFEGAFCEVMNFGTEYTLKLFNEWCELDFNGYYMELGNHWNGSFYK